MNFALTEEQALLRDSIGRYLAETQDFEAARRIMRMPNGFSRSLWQGLAELGLPGLLVAEADGGLGGSLTDAALAAEELGRHLAAIPFATSAVLAARLLSAAPSGSAARSLLARIATGERIAAVALDEPGGVTGLPPVATRAVRVSGGYRLSGRKIVVIDGAIADDLLVSADLDGTTALFHVTADGSGSALNRYATVDGRSAADLAIDGAVLSEDALVLGIGAAVALDDGLDAARLMLAAEALGLMERALELTIEQLKTRMQFGRRLSDFQVLTHRVSEMVVRRESARSILYRGLSLANADPLDRGRAISATMVRVLQSAEFIGSQAIQLHGGMGMSDEGMVGHIYKRLRVIGKTHGDLIWHMDRFIANTADGRAVA
ncbi:acyl-CoA dehydrogenase family protein [Prosthecodimorpha staleyi]|uniref:Acyl-CoA dehydrogenase n=1 Tax=Prosthecodimorpha staleyi TaxID=2840188 RepID=A0A947D4Q3_9HYPH|nr:acyl-CoA dehydrogenase [Prosthecodimorpha staleyi]MBT9290998.1 acyl-CoA dehydrogenase [Prosthecodimorpha staleyi]